MNTRRARPSGEQDRTGSPPGTRWTLLGLALLLAVFLGACASGPDTLDTESPPDASGELTTGHQVLNVVTFPFRMIGYGLYYSLKFVFYDIWAALFGCLFGTSAEPGSLDALLDQLDDPDPAVRARAAVELGFLGDPEAAPDLVPLLADDQETVRVASAQALGRLGPGRVEGEVLDLMSNTRKNEVRSAAAKALGLMKADIARFALLRALDDPDWKVRAEAAVALGRIGSWSAGPELADALRDPDPRVRGASAIALGTLRDRRALPYLKRVFRRLEQEGTFVRASVISSLAALEAEGLLEDLTALAKGQGPVKDVHSRSASLWALGMLGGKREVRLLADVLLDGDETLKVLEGAAVGLGAAGAADALASAAASEDVMTRIAAVRGLFELGGDEALDILSRLVKDPYADVRQRAIVSMLFLGFKGAVVFLIEQIGRADPEVRSWAWLELRRISGVDLGLDPNAWLAWWRETRDAWNLRRFYPEPPA